MKLKKMWISVPVLVQLGNRSHHELLNTSVQVNSVQMSCKVFV